MSSDLNEEQQIDTAQSLISTANHDNSRSDSHGEIDAVDTLPLLSGVAHLQNRSENHHELIDNEQQPGSTPTHNGCTDNMRSEDLGKIILPPPAEASIQEDTQHGLINVVSTTTSPFKFSAQLSKYGNTKFTKKILQKSRTQLKLYAGVSVICAVPSFYFYYNGGLAATRLTHGYLKTLALPEALANTLSNKQLLAVSTGSVNWFYNTTLTLDMLRSLKKDYKSPNGTKASNLAGISFNLANNAVGSLGMILLDHIINDGQPMALLLYTDGILFTADYPGTRAVTQDLLKPLLAGIISIPRHLIQPSHSHVDNSVKLRYFLSHEIDILHRKLKNLGSLDKQCLEQSVKLIKEQEASDIHEVLQLAYELTKKVRLRYSKRTNNILSLLPTVILAPAVTGYIALVFKEIAGFWGQLLGCFTVIPNMGIIYYFSKNTIKNWNSLSTHQLTTRNMQRLASAIKWIFITVSLFSFANCAEANEKAGMPLFLIYSSIHAGGIINALCSKDDFPKLVHDIAIVLEHQEEIDAEQILTIVSEIKDHLDQTMGKLDKLSEDELIIMANKYIGSDSEQEPDELIINNDNYTDKDLQNTQHTRTFKEQYFDSSEDIAAHLRVNICDRIMTYLYSAYSAKDDANESSGESPTAQLITQKKHRRCCTIM